MKLLSCFLGAISLAQVHASHHLSPPDKKIHGTALILKAWNGNTNRYDRVLLHQCKRTMAWIIPHWGWRKEDAGDASLEATVVRKFLIVTGLKQFPAVKNIWYYDYSGPSQCDYNILVFVAETDDHFPENFHCRQQSVILGHAFAPETSIKDRTFGRNGGEMSHLCSDIYTKSQTASESNVTYDVANGNKLKKFSGATLSVRSGKARVVMPVAKPAKKLRFPGSSESSSSSETSPSEVQPRLSGARPSPSGTSPPPRAPVHGLQEMSPPPLAAIPRRTKRRTTASWSV